MTTKTTSKKTSKTTTPAAAEINGATIALVFVASCETRKADAEKCKTIDADINAFKDVSFSRQIDKCIEKGLFTTEQMQTLSTDLAVTQESDNRFIGLKVIKKIRDAIEALALDQKSDFDKYTNSILYNLCKNQELSNKSALVSLSKSIEYTQDEQEAHIVKLINCAPSTASTQASSSRMMMRALGLANVTKRKNKDVITPADTPAAHAMRTMYAV